LYDYPARKKQSAALQLTLAEELPYYPLWSPRFFVVGSSRIAVSDGSRPAWSSPNWLWNADKWYLTK
ncbi:MAG: ABC transporter substrate-binding protein, partial [Candidatus Chloroheliales bacterium]